MNIKKKNEVFAAFWGSRGEYLKTCTEKTLVFLNMLKAHNPTLFGQWYQKGYSRKEALQKQVVFEYNYIKRLYHKKARDNDFPDLNFSMGIWTGHEDLLSTTLRCDLGGVYDVDLYNSCVLKLPFKDELRKPYDDEAYKNELIAIFRDVWNPETIKVDLQDIEF